MKIKTILLLLALCLTMGANAQTNEDVVDRVSRAVGVRLPDGYEAKVKEFVDTNKVLKDEDAANFTEQFIAEEMGKDWKIDKQSQLLFLWHCIYSEITGASLYNGEGGNTRIKEDFNAPGTSLRIRADKYKYQKNLIAEMKRISAEARQQSAEAIKGIKKADSLGLKECVKYYNLCINHPQTNDKTEIEAVKKAVKGVIENCKKYNIDYKAILRKELGDDKKVEELLKFYGVDM